jgi:hypothetical protein
MIATQALFGHLVFFVSHYFPICALAYVRYVRVGNYRYVGRTYSRLLTREMIGLEQSQMMVENIEISPVIAR